METKFWRVSGTRAGKMYQIRVRANDFDDAVRIASMEYMLVVCEVRLLGD